MAKSKKDEVAKDEEIGCEEDFEEAEASPDEEIADLDVPLEKSQQAHKIRQKLEDHLDERKRRKELDYDFDDLD